VPAYRRSPRGFEAGRSTSDDDEVGDCLLASGEQFEDTTPDWVAEDVESVHQRAVDSAVSPV